MPERAGGEEFWNNEARNLLAGVILYIHSQLPEEARTMWKLRHFLTLEREEFNLFLRDEILKCDNTQVQRAASSFL